MGQVLRTLIRQVIEERGFSMRFVSTQLEPPRDPTWLGKALRGERRLYLEDISRILVVISEPPEQFWRRHFAAISKLGLPHFADLEPAFLLAGVAARKTPQLPSQAARALRADLPRLVADPNDELAASLRRIDHLRLAKPQVALQLALEALEGALDRFGRLASRQTALAQIIRTLGVVASALRATGAPNAAAAVLARGFSLLDRETGGALFADLLYRSGVVLADLGYPVAGVAFVERSFTRFVLLGHVQDEIKALLALGVQSFYIGRVTIARQALERALRHPQATDGQIAIALNNLALACERTGRQDEALALLDRHRERIEQAAPKVAVGARWISARALVGVHRLEEAQWLYATLASDVLEYGDPIDPPILFCEHLALLYQLGQFTRAQRVAEELAGYCRDTELTPEAKTLLGDLLDDLARGASSASSVLEVARGLESPRI